MARTCAKCHADPELIDKFELPANIVDQYKSSVHGVALLKLGDVAAPTCNDCHVFNQALFNQTRMKSLFASRGLHGCAVCPAAHDIKPPGDEMVAINMHGFCSQCHQPGDAGGHRIGPNPLRS